MSLSVGGVRWWCGVRSRCPCSGVRHLSTLLRFLHTHLYVQIHLQTSPRLIQQLNMNTGSEILSGFIVPKFFFRKISFVPVFNSSVIGVLTRRLSYTVYACLPVPMSGRLKCAAVSVVARDSIYAKRAYAIAIPSVCPSVSLSICHTGDSCENGCS